MLFKAGRQRFALPLRMVKSVFRESVIGDCVPMTDDTGGPFPSGEIRSAPYLAPDDDDGFPVLRGTLEDCPVRIHDIAGFFYLKSDQKPLSPEDPASMDADETAAGPPAEPSAAGPGPAGKRIILLNDERYPDERHHDDPAGNALRVDDIEKVAVIPPASVFPLPPVFQGLCARWFPGVVLPGDGPPALILRPPSMPGFDIRRLFGGTADEPGTETGVPALSAPADDGGQAGLDAAISRLIPAEFLQDLMERRLRDHIRSGLEHHARTAARALGRLWTE